MILIISHFPPQNYDFIFSFTRDALNYLRGGLAALSVEMENWISTSLRSTFPRGEAIHQSFNYFIFSFIHQSTSMFNALQQVFTRVSITSTCTFTRNWISNLSSIGQQPPSSAFLSMVAAKMWWERELFTNHRRRLQRSSSSHTEHMRAPLLLAVFPKHKWQQSFIISTKSSVRSLFGSQVSCWE